jgi:FdhD protein
VTAAGGADEAAAAVVATPITRLRVGPDGAASAEALADAVAVERALEIRIGGQSLAVTLRTPGHDRELATGFLASEGIVRHGRDVTDLVERAADCADQPDVVEVTLAPGVALDWTRLERRFAATSACGLCGRAHVESLRAGLAPIDSEFTVRAVALAAWPDRLRAQQAAFARTGGIHAAALADERLEPVALREDVGRHNAVDKIAGALLAADRYPVRGGVLWVSGRAGAEIVLKAANAGIPVLAAVGAPSSLAIELARAARMTLVGFLREGRMNVYAGAERLRLDAG